MGKEHPYPVPEMSSTSTEKRLLVGKPLPVTGYWLVNRKKKTDTTSSTSFSSPLRVQTQFTHSPVLLGWVAIYDNECEGPFLGKEHRNRP